MYYECLAKEDDVFSLIFSVQPRRLMFSLPGGTSSLGSILPCIVEMGFYRIPEADNCSFQDQNWDLLFIWNKKNPWYFGDYARDTIQI